MEKVLIGAGGFAREIRAHMNNFSMKCFVDDKYYKENSDNILPISQFDETKYQALVAVGDPRDRFDIVQRLPNNTQYFTFIHPSALVLGNDVEIGEGSIICAGVIITTNVKVGKHTHLNLQTTIGHDCTIGDYFTTAPGVNISGNCKIYDMVYVGTNAALRQELTIHSGATIGLNAGVVKHIEDSGTYTGVPAKKLIRS
jgi:sugar O-acyltransferase (sialic acid O-acetyltransferase NeuD family)